MFKLNPILLGFIAAQGMMFSVLNASAAILKPYTPEINDNKVGVYCLCNGSTQTLSGLPQFVPGESGVTRITLGDLQRIGRIIDDSLIGQERLDIGQQNLDITIPDPGSETDTVYHVYNSYEFNALPVIGPDTEVPDYYDVKDQQYIGARVASVSNGTINVDIGQQGAATHSGTNGWSMAAKQSQLFTASKRGHLNWNSDNRITFTAAVPPYAGDRLTYNIGSVVSYTGVFTVNTLDGGTTQFNVTNLAELSDYNDWLINQLLNNGITQEDYSIEFHKAFSLHDGSVVYRMSTDNSDDEVAQPLGDQGVLSANGPHASVKVSAGHTLEVVNSSSAAVRANNGATAMVDGKLAVTGSVQPESKALELLKGSHGINNGVINSGFLNNANGEGVDSSTLGYVGKAVAVTGGSQFINNGVLNLAAGNPSPARVSNAIWLNKGSAINHGNINIGVADVSNGSAAAGVSFSGESSFINAEDGTIYIGRSPQNHILDNTQDVAVNLSGGVSGIHQRLNASAINNGRIIIGAKVQNAVGMRVESGPNALALNNGVIDVNGRAQAQPAENIGILALDAGSGGRVGNTGTINLNGDNSTGIKVIATNGNSASAYSTGTINVNGNADTAGGTNNTAVWVNGLAGGSARADLSGPVYLNGKAAIGIRAEGNATVNVAANAVPYSTGGQDQIGFFIIGPDARINLPTHGSYVTSGQNATLFRLLDGADFDGNGMTLSLNAPGSTGVIASGNGSDILTNGAIFNIGAYATGVKVEGGAQGTIDAATRLRLTGEGSTAATVDGYKHDLRGNAVFDPGALLINHASISGLANYQLGLLAQDRGQLVNTGDMTLGGEGATGIVARFGAKVANSGDISVTRGGVGLYAEGYDFPEDSTVATEITNSGTLNVYGVPGSTLQPTYGAVASKNRAVLNQNGTLNLYGDNAVGARADNAARINTGSTSSVVFHNDNQIGYQATDADSIIFSSGGKTNVSTKGSTLYQLSNGGNFLPLVPTTVTLNGINSTGISASGRGSLIFATDAFNVNGNGAVAVRVYDLAEGIISRDITLNGDNTIGAVSAGDQTTLYAASQITGNGSHTVAFDVGYYAALFNQYQAVVDLTGPNSTGARVHDVASFINRGSIHVASGTGLDVSSGYGYYSPVESQLRVDDGIAALRVGSGAALEIGGDGQGISTLSANGRADGLLLDSGAQWFNANDIILGAYGSGNAINNRAETTSITLQNVRLETGRGAGIRSAVSFDPDGSAQIYVGSGGTGYLFANEDGSTTSNDLLIGQGYSIVVPGEGTGVRANTTGNVIARGTIDIQSANGGPAIITRTASRVINQGTIASQSVVAPIIDLRGGQSVFINEGTITAPNPDTVVVAGGATNDVIALLDGKVVGDVDTGNGTDSLIMTGSTLNGSLTMGTGTDNQATLQKVSLANTAHITTAGGAGSTLTLGEIEARGGSFPGDNLSKGTNIGAGWSTLNFIRTLWQLTDNIKLAHSTINIDGGSTLFAGNGVKARLQGATNDSLRVNNAGTLDLTNGGNTANNTLTIDGDLASANGTLRLNSTVTQSDALHVNGNVSGTTFVDDSLIGGSPMAGNRDGVIAATEGVSLAQVSGNASANSFALKRGYVASGPWQYSLYSFAPGSSDASQRQLTGSGNNFWDYRLANTFVCEDGSLCQPQAGSGRAAVRPAVTPQVPSYISMPTGLAYYQLAIADNLHKRLGELRHQQSSADALGGEMFIRYLGSNLKYQSDRGLSDYGYDFDLTYNAVQLGGNLIHLDGAQDSLRGGIAYTRGNSRIRPHAADGYSSTSFNSDSLALYGTWQHNSAFYVDGSLTWTRHRGKTDIARQKEVASPKGNGWTASLESGYPFEFSNGVRLEPQAQLTLLHTEIDSFTDRDRTRVSYEDNNQTIGRLGARLDRTWQDENLRQYTPYISTHYYRGWGGTAKTKIGSADGGISQNVDNGRFGQMWDVGIGGTTQFRNDVSLYAETDYRKEIDGNGAKGWHYTAGVRWSF